ncbi:MAG: ABC transporter permease [Actinomycetes bacterium]
MYPVLVRPLAIGLAAALAFIAFLVVRRPVLRRLALRQISRRPTEALIVVIGSLLGTTLIVASLVVGDSLDRSVRQGAYDVLGPIDEVVRTPSAVIGEQVVTRLDLLRTNRNVDGVLAAHQDLAAATRGEGASRVADPRVIVSDLDFAQAARFGGPGASGLAAADPGPHGVVVNQHLADTLDAVVGDRITFYLYGRPYVFTVTGVVPAKGLAGSGFGASVNRDAFFSPGTLTTAARAVGQEPLTTVFLSNRGNVESGVNVTRAASAAANRALGGLATQGAVLTAPKKEVLDAAERTSAQLGSLFLFIASFSIIAGILLLVNVFVMLADERKGQLGMLRAIGMRRRRVTAEFAIEGAVYAAVAALLGVAVGVAVGRVVVVIAVNILNNFERSDNRLAIAFDARWQSLFNGAASGFLIAFIAVVLTSVRIARSNIIESIRDLPHSERDRPRRQLTIASIVGTVVFGAASVPALAASQGATTYLLPALTATCAIGWLRLLMPVHRAVSMVATGVLVWGLIAHLVRPHMYDDSTTATYVVMGTMLSFAAVVLIAQHQSLLLRPFRFIVERPGERGLAARLAVTYPTARRFRTGATLGMYCIVVLVIVLLAQISAMIHAGLSSAVNDASAGWTLRADFNPDTPPADVERALGEHSQGQVTSSAPLVTAVGFGTDPLGRWTEPLPVLAVGYPGQVTASPPTLSDRLPGLATDHDAWALPLRDPGYVLVDAFYGATGGPQGKPLAAGDRITLTDPRTGERSPRVIAGILKDGTGFYGATAGEFRFPVLMSNYSARSLFGVDARLSSILLRTTPSADRAALVSRLQGTYLANGLVISDIPQEVRKTYAANTQMFRLMQGYLAMGLIVAITGLGVVMVRSVRERRRTIGVLRALGVQAKTVRRAFLAESSFIALEGVAVGTVLGVLTTWLLYRNSPAFETLDVAFPVAWAEITFTVGLAFVASFLATLVPARRAAAVRPATAVRVAE